MKAGESSRAPTKSSSNDSLTPSAKMRDVTLIHISITGFGVVCRCDSDLPQQNRTMRSKSFIWVNRNSASDDNVESENVRSSSSQLQETFFRSLKVFTALCRVVKQLGFIAAKNNLNEEWSEIDSNALKRGWIYGYVSFMASTGGFDCLRRRLLMNWEKRSLI